MNRSRLEGLVRPWTSTSTPPLAPSAREKWVRRHAYALVLRSTNRVNQAIRNQGRAEVAKWP